MGTEDESSGFASKKEMKGFGGGEGGTPPDPTLSVPGASCLRGSRRATGPHQIGAVILGNLLGMVGDAVTVWAALLEGRGGCGHFPLGLRTEPGPAAPLMFSFFSSLTFRFSGGRFVGL